MTTFSGLFGGAAGVGPYATPHMGYKSGKYYTVPNIKDGASDAGFTMVAGTIYYFPFYVHSDITISALSFANFNTSANGHLMRVGIYNNDNGAPSSLVVAASPVTLTATAAAREVAVSASLAKGWYWFAFQGNSATSISAFSGASAAVDNFGWSQSGLALAPGDTSGMRLANSVTSTYGALPSPALQPTATSSAQFAFLCGIKVA